MTRRTRNAGHEGWPVAVLALGTLTSCARGELDGIGDAIGMALLLLATLAGCALLSLVALVAGAATAAKNARGWTTRRSYRWGIVFGLYNTVLGLLALSLTGLVLYSQQTLGRLGACAIAGLVFGIGCWGLFAAVKNPPRAVESA